MSTYPSLSMENFEELLQDLKLDLIRDKQKDTEVKGENDEQLNSSVYFGSSGSSDRSDSSNPALVPAFTLGPDPNVFKGNNGNEFTGPKAKNPRSFKLNLLGFCEEFYHENYRLPTPKELQLRFRGHKECPQFLEDWPERILEIRDLLEVRGIDVEQSPVGDLDPRFVTAVHLILNYNDKRTLPAKLKSLNISTASWSAWLKKPHYRAYYRKHGDLIFNDEFQAEAQRSLMASVSSGDLQAVKFYYEVSGAYRPQESATQQVISQLMLGLFEVLAKHLPANQIALIGAEIREAPSIQRVMGAIEAETRSDFEERKLG